jgi:hypothetical protein
LYSAMETVEKRSKGGKNTRQDAVESESRKMHSQSKASRSVSQPPECHKPTPKLTECLDNIRAQSEARLPSLPPSPLTRRKESSLAGTLGCLAG